MTTYRTAILGCRSRGTAAARAYHAHPRTEVVALCDLLRERLDMEGFQNVKTVASSGFGPEKCRVMGSVKAPINVVGTGSYLPDRWTETYATADIIAYDGEPRVKLGREFLLRRLDGQE